MAGYAVMKKGEMKEENCSGLGSVPGKAVKTLQELRDDVFKNDVVWRNLGKYLSLSDLKVCLLVSRGFNRKVMDATNFKTRLVTHLEKLKHQVFSTDLVWWNLGQFLSVSDFKVCRLVSRTFNRKVMDATNFTTRSVVRLPMERED